MRINHYSRQGITETLRNAYPADVGLYLKFGDCVVRVRMNRPELKTGLSGYFAAFVVRESDPDIDITVHEAKTPDFSHDFVAKTPDPGKTKVKEAFAELADGRIVRKLLTGMHFIFGDGDNLAVGPCLANVNQVINFINNRYIEWSLHQGGLLGHAAGVAVPNAGLALAGFSGMGKSTLALHMLRFGVDFVSNDRLMIKQTGCGLIMSGVAKHPRINPGTAMNNENLKTLITEEDRSRYAALSKEDLWHLEEKYDAPVETYFPGSRFVLSAPMTGLFILNWQHDNPAPPVFAMVDPNRRRDLLAAFMKDTGLFYHPPKGAEAVDSAEDEYAQLLKSCVVVEVKGGVDFDAAARFGQAFLENSGYPVQFQEEWVPGHLTAY